MNVYGQLRTENKFCEKETIVFSEPDIITEDSIVTINIEQAEYNLFEENKPIIPKFIKTYTFPLGTKINHVELIFGDSKEYFLDGLIKSAPQPQLLSIDYNFDYSYNQIIDYSDIDIYPGLKYDYHTGAGLQKGEHVLFLNIHIYPLQYVPTENIIYFSETVDIEINYNLPDEKINFPDQYDLLIITPSDFSSELQPLADFKNERNIKTIITTLDEIPSQGLDEQESIKYYIKDSIERWGIKYVILIGAGVEGKEIFPVRNAWVPSGNYEKSFPSDLYYADVYNSDMQFSDWDKDGDGKFAEFSNTGNDMSNVDMYPDVYLSRLPCNDINEVKTIVEKIMYYSKHNKMVNKIMQIGGDTFPGDPEKINEGEYANNEVLTKLSGYTSLRIWASEKEGAQALNKNNIANGFNEGVDYVDFSGHGSWGSWATHATQDNEVWLPAKTLISPYTGWLYIDYDMYQFSNEWKLPVVVFNACSCSKYSDSANCISWKTIKGINGGIASFGASGIGYGSYGSSETKRFWGWMEVNIFKGLFNDKILGEVWGNSLNGYINTHYSNDWGDADYKTILEMAMFGDPTLVIDDGENPKNKDLDTFNVENSVLQFIDYFPIIKELIEMINNRFRL
jgi:hypothetical protein